MDFHQKVKIFNLDSESFDALALEIFAYQYAENRVYRQFVDCLNVNPRNVTTIYEIPFLPIEFFKSHRIVSGLFDEATIFESSTTTGVTPAKHYVKDLGIYIECAINSFENNYGALTDYCILALLPSYLERGNSSLVFMVDEFIKRSENAGGFYLYNHQELYRKLSLMEAIGQKTILFGVTYALLDFAENFPMQLWHTTIIETGGMKGRKRELTRGEVHDLLKKAFELDEVHSEYGMTELLSQAYSPCNGRFYASQQMRVLPRADDNPLNILQLAETDKPVNAAINIIDLANIYSCSFIATGDLGKFYADGSFEVLGRIDNSDIRGCSLMAI